MADGRHFFFFERGRGLRCSETAYGGARPYISPFPLTRHMLIIADFYATLMDRPARRGVSQAFRPRDAADSRRREFPAPLEATLPARASFSGLPSLIRARDADIYYAYFRWHNFDTIP